VNLVGPVTRTSTHKNAHLRPRSALGRGMCLVSIGTCDYMYTRRSPGPPAQLPQRLSTRGLVPANHMSHATLHDRSLIYLQSRQYSTQEDQVSLSFAVCHQLYRRAGSHPRSAYASQSGLRSKLITLAINSFTHTSHTPGFRPRRGTGIQGVHRHALDQGVVRLFTPPSLTA